MARHSLFAAQPTEKPECEPADPKVYQVRRGKIVAAWYSHVISDHGGNFEKALYDASLGQTYIECCMKGCKWNYELK